MIAEDVVVGSVLGEFVAHDPDLESNGNITFEIISGDTSIFSIMTVGIDSSVQTYAGLLMNDQVAIA